MAMNQKASYDFNYCKFPSFNKSPLEANDCFFILLLKVIFDPYLCTVNFGHKVYFLISNAC